MTSASRFAKALLVDLVEVAWRVAYQITTAQQAMKTRTGR